MTAPVPDAEARWTRRRWLVVFALLLALQSGLVLGLARWPRLAGTPAGDGSLSRLVVSATGRLPAGTVAGDPRQFAGPDPQGFSGSAARALPPSDYSLAELPGRPMWLGADSRPGRVGAAPPPIPPPVMRTMGVPMASLGGETRSPLLLPTNTMVYPRGALAGLALKASPPPLVLTGTEVLNPTVVEVGVSPAGDVMVTRVARSSGNPEADGRAFAWAQGVRFSELAPDAGNDVQIGPLTWGELAFIWRVQPPAP